MSSISYTHDGGDYITEQVDTDNQTAEIRGHLPFRMLSVSLAGGYLVNDGTDTETVSVRVVDGLEVARGTDPADATVLDYNDDVTLSADGQQTTKTLTNGSVEFEISTDKPAGSQIEIIAESLGDHPAASDSATIEVTNP